MICRCALKSCPHFSAPCEFDDRLVDYKCPIGEGYIFDAIPDPENEFFCLIVGSRSFNNYELFCEKMDLLLKNMKDKKIIIVTGGARGADSLAEKYAEDRDYKCYVINADWNAGKKAGHDRNEEMHAYIAGQDHRGCVAFWDGKSPGTAQSFELAEKYNNPIRVVRV